MNAKRAIAGAGGILAAFLATVMASGSVLAEHEGAGTCALKGECKEACACKTGGVRATEPCADCKAGKQDAAEELSPMIAAAKAKVEAAGIGFLTAKQLTARMKAEKPPVVVDVLDADSYKKSRIKGAVNIPMADIARKAPNLLPDKKAEIVVYCGSYQCGASLKAAVALKELGYLNIHDYKGGLKEWTELKLPLEGEDRKEPR